VVPQVSAPMLARYEHQRAQEVGRWTVRHELGLMGRGLRMAHRLGVIDRLPELPRPPKGEHRTDFSARTRSRACSPRAAPRAIPGWLRW